MYIKLGKLNLQYHQDTSDWMIMAEILDSGMSYNKPILVRTTDELDIWFGKDFPDYDYMVELLNLDIVLYLYKPISTKTTGGQDYIDLSEYTIDDSIWLRDSEIEWITNVLGDPEKYKFRYIVNDNEVQRSFKINNSGKLVLSTSTNGKIYCTKEIVREELPGDIIKIFNNNPGFNVYDSNSMWIYRDGEIIDTSLLPQNINLTSTSIDNRDTLYLGQNDSIISYTYLDYNDGDWDLGIYSWKDIVDRGKALLQTQYLGEIDMNFVSEGYQSLVFEISGTLEDDNYFVIPGANHGTNLGDWKLFYTTQIPTSVDPKYYRGGTVKINNITDLKNGMTSLGYQIVNQESNKFLALSPSIIPVTYFYSSQTLKINPETKITEKILSKYVTPGFKMWSKTIGRGSKVSDENDFITVTIERADQDNYRMIISRYDYTETFEGPLNIKNISDTERLDFTITNNSKLIDCTYLGGEVQTGTYKLRGAVIEETTPEMYLYSLENMFTDSHEIVYPDYFLVPDKYKFVVNKNPDDSYLPVYDKFLEYSKQVECQFLIENTDPYDVRVVDVFPSNPEEGVYYKIGDLYYDYEENLVTDTWFLRVVNGDYVMNYLEDKENRLVYFYRGFRFFDTRRPAYYVYLRGLLVDEYSVSTKDILYNEPTQDPYITEDIEPILERYKTNYMVCNNLIYYYKKYQNGDYITTGWMRFVAGKIARELQKHKWDYLGQQLFGRTRTVISSILWTINESFSIVNSITLTNFVPNATENRLYLQIETSTNDLVDNNLRLDFTVDYNNLNT